MKESKMLNYALLFAAVLIISAVQLVVKYRLNVEHGQVPFQLTEAGYFAIGILKDPWLWLAGSMLVVSALMWYSAISRISLGVAFAFAALSYPMVMLGARFFLGEIFLVQQYAGCALIVFGLFLIAAYT
jgi:drug/metabolite transporter (DMT)-like permease